MGMILPVFLLEDDELTHSVIAAFAAMSRLNICSMLFSKIASGGELMAFVCEADHFLDLLRFRLQRFRLCECRGVSGRQLELWIFPGVHAVGGLKWGTSKVFFRHHI